MSDPNAQKHKSHRASHADRKAEKEKNKHAGGYNPKVRVRLEGKEVMLGY